MLILCIVSEKIAAAPYLPHEDLSPADEHRGVGDVEPLLQPLQIELLHLLIAALHLHWVEGEHGQSLHVLRGRQIGEGDGDQRGISIITRRMKTKTEKKVELMVQDQSQRAAEDTP